MALVFQFGSNMSTLRLNSMDRLRGDAKLIGLVRTVGQYNLGFTVWSKTNNCAAADLVRARGRHVWGVLYQIPEKLLSRDTAGNRRSLDEIEGTRYKRRKIRIYKLDDSNKVLTVWTYTVIKKRRGLLTSREYATHILKGLHEHEAPKYYITHVKKLILRNNPELKGQI